MADTGAPWNIPYVEPTDLVRTYPAASEDLADAVAAGLTVAAGLVVVKSALFTGIQSASVTASSNLSVTNLTITHALANASNKLIISAFFGAAASTSGRATVGIAVHDGTGLIAIGDAEGTRSRVTAGGVIQGFSLTEAALIVTMPSVTYVHAPGDTTSRTYTVRAVNIDSSTRTLFINRSEQDTNTALFPRAVSGFVVQEVRV